MRVRNNKGVKKEILEGRINKSCEENFCYKVILFKV